MSLITEVQARQTLDEHGTPMLEVDVALDDGGRGRAVISCKDLPEPPIMGRTTPPRLQVLMGAGDISRRIAPVLVGLDVRDVEDTLAGLRVAADQPLHANALAGVSRAAERAGNK